MELPLKYHITNYSILFNEKDEFLLLKYTNGGWAFPGGHLEYGENWKESLLREIKEEINVESKHVELKLPIHINNWEHKGKFYFGTTTLGNVYTDKVVLSDEHEDYRWISKEDFHKIIPAFPDYFEIVKNAYGILGL